MPPWPFAPKPISDSRLALPALGLGCGTLGDPDEVISEARAQQTLQRAWDLGVRYFDTAPWYGNTQSEHRLGYFLRQQARNEFMVSTKVGRVYFRPDDPVAYRSSRWMQRWKGGLPFDLRFDYRGDAIERSYEDSLMRLGLNRVDALVIHDLDPRHQEGEANVARGLEQLDTGGGFKVLEGLRSSGEIKAIGAGINHVGMIPRFLERFAIDYFLVAMPYTLLDQPALDEELAMCAEHNVHVIIGAVFASGILATGPSREALYAYKPAEAQIRDRVAAIAACCERHGIELNAAALQFPLGHRTVRSVIPGANSTAQIQSNVDAMGVPIPQEFWADLKDAGLLRNDAPVPVTRSAD